MGADLYINKVREPIKQEWQPKFDAAVEVRNSAADPVSKDAAQKLVDEAYEKLFSDGYFRDSYNGTGILGRIGLSWWQDMEYDVEGSDDINVSADGCRKFLAKVIAAGEPAQVTFEELKADHCKVEESGENSVESWNTFYRDKYRRLIAFLEQAIEHGGMYASC